MSAQITFERFFSSPPAQPRLSPTDLRESGIESALAHVERVKGEYVELCLSVIERLPAGAMINSEDVRDRAGDPPEGCENSMAGILRKAASKRLIVITDNRVHAKRVSLHAAELRLWQRL